MGKRLPYVRKLLTESIAGRTMAQVKVMGKMTGADLLAGELKRRGVSFIAVLCGHGLNPLLYAAQRAGIRIIDVHNEQTASYIADAYARLTRRMGICAVSSGVAHVNAFAGLLNARFDCAPVLLITGASELRNLGRGAFQDVDQVHLAMPICKRAELVTCVERIPHAVHESFNVATTGCPGPVHLTIPLDVLTAKVDPNAIGVQPHARSEVRRRVATDAQSVRDAVRMLASARAPLIVAGTGAFYADAGDELLSFASLSRIPIVTPIWDRGVIDHPSQYFLGVIGAASGEPRLLEDVDVLILAGAQVDYRIRYLDRPPLRKDVRVIRIDADSTRLHQGIEPDVALLGDPKSVFSQLTDEWKRAGHRTHDQWLAEAQRRHRQFYMRWSKPAMINGCISGAHVVHAVRNALNDDDVLLIDGGNIGQWAHFVLCNDRYPSHWLTCGASAVVGWGIGGAIGARLAFPKRNVLLLSGDGAIGFNIMDIESAVRQGLPFVVIVADDSAWGIVVSGQRAYMGETIASTFSEVDYAGIASALGAHGVSIEAPDELPNAIREGFASGEVMLIHVRIAIGGPADVR